MGGRIAAADEGALALVAGGDGQGTEHRSSQRASRCRQSERAGSTDAVVDDHVSGHGPAGRRDRHVDGIGLTNLRRLGDHRGDRGRCCLESLGAVEEAIDDPGIGKRRSAERGCAAAEVEAEECRTARRKRASDDGQAAAADGTDVGCKRAAIGQRTADRGEDSARGIDLDEAQGRPGSRPAQCLQESIHHAVGRVRVEHGQRRSQRDAGNGAAIDRKSEQCRGAAAAQLRRQINHAGTIGHRIRGRRAATGETAVEHDHGTGNRVDLDQIDIPARPCTQGQQPRRHLLERSADDATGLSEGHARQGRSGRRIEHVQLPGRRGAGRVRPERVKALRERVECIGGRTERATTAAAGAEIVQRAGRGIGTGDEACSAGAIIGQRIELGMGARPAEHAQQEQHTTQDDHGVPLPGLFMNTRDDRAGTWIHTTFRD